MLVIVSLNVPPGHFDQRVTPCLMGPTKSGTIVDKELRKQRYRKPPKGYSMRPYVKVMWDIRSVAEWVIELE